MRLRLVHPSKGNRFMREIFEAITFEARLHGVDAEVVDDIFPDEDDLAYVVIPHEYFALVPMTAWPDTSQLSRTIALTVEHPGTSHFELSAVQAKRCGAVLDINTSSTAALNKRGVPAKHFQVGYSQAWDRWERNGRQRSMDIRYLGSIDPRREHILASGSTIWWDRAVALSLSDGLPIDQDDERHLLGERKLTALADTNILINIHRDHSQAFEWVRVVEAVCNGCVVVSEHSVDAAPFRAGEHYVSADAAHLPSLARGLLDDPDHLDNLRFAAYDFLKEEVPMATAVEDLLQVAENLVERPAPVPGHAEVPILGTTTRPDHGWPDQVTQIDLLAAGVRRIEGRLRNIDKAIGQLTAQISGFQATDSHFVTPSYADASPKVSVVIPVYNRPDLVLEAVSSVMASTGVSYEVLVQDDGSPRDSLGDLRQLLAENPWVPAHLVRSAQNKGLSATRNDLWRRARGEYVFALDDDNGVYPPALSRLASALDDDPEAAFAYSILVIRQNGLPTGLVSRHAWHPELLRMGNYIDAMAMLRRSTLERFGGWSEAMRFGWEDFHLWARIADAGLSAAFVPQALAWYRASQHSMLVSTNLDIVTQWSRIRADAPNLMADA